MMNESLLLTFCVACTATALLCALVTKPRSAAITPLPLFIFASVLLCNIGFFVYFFRYRSEAWAQTALLSISCGILLAGLGGIVGAIITRVRPAMMRFGQGNDMKELPFGVAMAGAIIVFGIVLVYFYFLGYVPLFRSIQQLIEGGMRRGLLNIERVARDVYVNPEARYIPLQGFMEQMRYFGLPMVTIWFLDFYRRGKRPRVSLTVCGIAVLLIALTGQRWPLMGMLIAMVVYLSWTVSRRREYRKEIRRLAVTGGVFGLLLSVLLARFEPGEQSARVVWQGAGEVIERFVLGNARIPFLSYQLFPAREGWLHGRSWWQNLISFVPGPQPSYPVTFYQLVTGDRIGFSAPPDFYTEAYINFGWVGIVVIPFVWGAVLHVAQLLIVYSGTSALNLSIGAVLCTYAGLTAVTGIVFLLGAVLTTTFVWVLLRSLVLVRTSLAHNTTRVSRNERCQLRREE